MNDGTVIKIWPFKDAPVEYQSLSENGGDEDWIVVLNKDRWLVETENDKFVSHELLGLVNSFYHECMEKFYLSKNNEVVLVLCHA